MQIFHYGNGFIKLVTKSPQLGDSIVLIDPYQTKTWGLRQPKMDANVVISFDPKFDSKLIDTNSFIISEPGEYENREIAIYGIDADENNGTVFIIKTEGITIGHVNSLKSTVLSDTAQEFLNDLDILFIPIGGVDTIDGKQAGNLVQKLEPRIVIPICYKYKGAITKQTDEKAFLKELGISKFDETEKFVIKKNELPVDEIKIVLLHP